MSLPSLRTTAKSSLQSTSGQQYIAKCGNRCDKMWQHVRTYHKLLQKVGKCDPSVKTLVCPDPVWKLVSRAPSVQRRRVVWRPPRREKVRPSPSMI